jgi:uncharacterized protein (UPF0548 family)
MQNMRLDPFFISFGRRPSAEEEAAVVARGQRLGFNYASPGASRDLVWPDDDDDDDDERATRAQHRRRRRPTLPLPPAAEADARHNGAWAVDRARVKVGYGRATYLQTRDLVRRWGAFQLPWAQVDPARTGSAPGDGVCVAARLLGGLVWTAVPLRVTVREERRRWPVALLPPPSPSGGERGGGGGGAAEEGTARGRRFLLAHGCLRSHFLAGEERFSVEWRRDGSGRGGGGGSSRSRSGGGGHGDWAADDGGDDDGGPVYFEVATYSRPAHPLAALGYPVVRGLQAAFRRDAARHVARAAAVATVDRSTGGVEAAGPWWETEAGLPAYAPRRPGGVLGLIAGLVDRAGSWGAAPAAAAELEGRRRVGRRRRRRANGAAPSVSCGPGGGCSCCGSGAS